MKQENISLPEIWLMVLIIALPQLSETVYTPSLPDIAKFLATSHALVEHTLTIFLFGLALGTLFWGKLSDKFGRRPALLSGLVIYSIGCVGCYFSTTIAILSKVS
jgi:MFS family permease